ncbi:MAG: HAD family hydrolase [Actinomycetota bacterium]
MSRVIEIIFFDAGETILHPHPSFPELFADIVNRRGYSIATQDIAEVQERLAPHLVDLAEETGIEHGPSLSPTASRTFWTYLYRRFLAEVGVEDESLADELYAIFSSTSSYRLFDDVLPALAELEAAGYRLGLISNFEGWLEKILVELEVGHLFDVSVISGVEGVEKPDPRIYEIALQRAGVLAENAMHVGDSPKLDVEPASSVGISVVLLDRAGRYPEVSPRITSLEDLPPLMPTL